VGKYKSENACGEAGVERARKGNCGGEEGRAGGMREVEGMERRPRGTFVMVPGVASEGLMGREVGLEVDGDRGELF